MVMVRKALGVVGVISLVAIGLGGFALHIFTAWILYFRHGFYGAVFGFVFPILSQIYVCIRCVPWGIGCYLWAVGGIVVGFFGGGALACGFDEDEPWHPAIGLLGCFLLLIVAAMLRVFFLQITAIDWAAWKA